MVTTLQVSNLAVPPPEGHFKEKLTSGGTTKQLMLRLKITSPFSIGSRISLQFQKLPLPPPCPQISVLTWASACCSKEKASDASCASEAGVFRFVPADGDACQEAPGSGGKLQWAELTLP